VTDKQLRQAVREAKACEKHADKWALAHENWSTPDEDGGTPCDACADAIIAVAQTNDDDGCDLSRPDKDDADFIAYAREDIPRLLALVERLSKPKQKASL